MSTSPLATTVVANQLLSQLDPKIFDGLVLGTGGVMLVKDECIGNCNIQQKIKYVLIELSAFHVAAVIPTKLIASVYSAHELIVADDSLWAWHWSLSTILLLPKDCTRGSGLCVG